MTRLALSAAAVGENTARFLLSIPNLKEHRQGNWIVLNKHHFLKLREVSEDLCAYGGLTSEGWALANAGVSFGEGATREELLKRGYFEENRAKISSFRALAPVCVCH